MPEEQDYILGGIVRGKQLPEDQEIFAIHYRGLKILKELGLMKTARAMLRRNAGSETLASPRPQAGWPMTEAVAPDRPRLAGAPLVVVTRSSFLGRSGWKSDAARDAALLFGPERLRLRTELFRTITLPSLVAQTDRDLTHVILTSGQLPHWAMAELNEACATA